jgi:MFS family permease
VGGFLVLFIVLGVGFYSFAVFLKAVQAEFNWGRGETSGALLMFYLVQAGSSPFIGKLTDRFGPRRVITVGSLLLGLGLALLSFTGSLLHFYVAYGIAGLGYSTAGMIPVFSVVSGWFSRRMGFAIGIVSSGMGAGGFVIPLVVGGYLIPDFGWRVSYQILCLVALLVVVIAQLVIKIRPVVETHIAGAEKVDKAREPVQRSEGWTLRSTLRTPTFWFIVVAFMLFQFGQVGTTQHLVVHLTDIGFNNILATAMLSAVNITSSGGKLFFGYLSDRLPTEFCAMIGFLLALGAALVLLTVNSASPLVVIGLYVLAMGLAVGCWAPMSSMLIGTNFGMTYYGAVFGAFSLFFYASTGISPVYFGFIYDATGEYFLAYMTAVVSYCVAIALMVVLHIRKRSSTAKLTGRHS